MYALIVFLYANLLGRAPSTTDVLSWLAAFEGKSAHEASELFLGSRPEPGSVVSAYREFLGREPGPSEIETWVTTASIRAMREGISASPEAKNVH